MPLYLAPTAAAATTTLPRPQLLPASSSPPPPSSIDLRRLERGGMSLPAPPPPSPPPPLLSSSNSHVIRAKHKAVVVLGATGTGKSRLAVDLARRFGGEVINSDKVQLHAGLPVTTNKVTAHERAGVPHHLLGVAAPDAELTADGFFRRAATLAARAVTARGALPIVAGGSNTFVEELVDGGDGAFRERYECCFIWVDVQRAVLHGHVDRRVDEMLARGLVDEVAAAFYARRRGRRRRTGDDGDEDEGEEEYGYEKGIWRAIGVPELDAYLRWSSGREGDGGEGEGQRLLAAAVEEIKGNTRRLSCRQRGKIQRLAKKWGNVRRVDATEVFRRRGGGDAADEAWRRIVAAPCIDAVRNFLCNDDDDGAAAADADDLAAAADVVPVFAPRKQAAAVVAG